MRQRAIVEELQRPENAEIAKLFERSVNLMMRHLLWRHMFLTLLVGLTLFGALGIFYCARWLSQRIVSGAIKPVSVQRSNDNVAHAA